MRQKPGPCERRQDPCVLLQRSRVSRIFGANIFSSWREQTEAEQLEEYKRIEGFDRVEPRWPDEKQRESLAADIPPGAVVDDDFPF